MKVSTSPIFGLVVFPGTNCEHDCYHSIKNIIGAECKYIWHQDRDARGVDAIVLPGGFSYGDYLRSGAVARFSPIMSFVRKFAEKNKPIIGICNGFQILLEEGILPGAMLRNNTLKFICKFIHAKIENIDTPFTSNYKKGQVLKIPIRHNEGNYYINRKGLKQLEKNNQILLRYSSENGEVSERFNPNGSVENIAGICNREKNVFGLMPHPEACCESRLGSIDGQDIFRSMINHIRKSY
jgi:phosphoribosylformylglycinamidine synthase subunit PurQ / glutaminase